MRTKPLWLWVAIGAFIATAVFINPLRQTTLDDDWAYALTVRGIVEGNGYHLHDWAAANMPFQAYVGPAFPMLLGYSPAVLRVTTLLFALIGLVAFYKLAREHDLDERQAGLLSLAWVASPLLLRMSYSFMTDVTFVSWMVVALWLYARAFRTG